MQPRGPCWLRRAIAQVVESVHRRTFSSALHKSDRYATVAIKKSHIIISLLKENHKNYHLQFAISHYVKHYVWQKTTHHSEHTVPTVEHGGGSSFGGVSLWTGTGRMARIGWKMDEAKYWAILEESLLEFTSSVLRRKTLETGVAIGPSSKKTTLTKHKARSKMEWSKTKHIHVLEWSSQSLNLIENLWQDLKTAVHKRSWSSLNRLELFCKEEQANVSVCKDVLDV